MQQRNHAPARERLAVFARFPEAGRAKTRLIPALGPEGAAQLHEQMVRHTLRRIDALRQSRDVQVEIWFDGADSGRFQTLFGPRAYCAQAGSDLGDRMSHTLSVMLADADAAVIIGTDCPALDERLLGEAFDALRANDLVLGPASDGGYYLIGLRKPAPGLFDQMPWSTERVLAETLRRAERLGLSVHQLSMLHDVDEPRDLGVWERFGTVGTGSPPVLSIVIPTWNEAARIGATIESARRDRVEIIVADGGSTDETREIAAACGAQVIAAPRGRGPQLNAGAAVARADALLFLHADTTLPREYLEAVHQGLLEGGVALGAFRLRIDRPGLPMRLVELGVRLRCGLFATPYGDQAFFLRSETFKNLGGFAGIPLLEDLDLVRRARAIGRIRMVEQEVVTSGRRWEVAGVVRMSLVNQLCLIGFGAGVAPQRLAAWRDRLSGARVAPASPRSERPLDSTSRPV